MVPIAENEPAFVGVSSWPKARVIDQVVCGTVVCGAKTTGGASTQAAEARSRRGAHSGGRPAIKNFHNR